MRLWIHEENQTLTKEKEMIDWTDGTQQVSNHFTVKECLYLPTWKRLANESDGLTEDIQNNLVTLCGILDQIRDFMGQPINVHCMYRPPAYNDQIGAPTNDVHSMGQAVDFDMEPNITCDQVKDHLKPVLQKYRIRMENNGNGANWVHIDIHPVGFARFFNP
jgi:uncharacterized protein YcbK (DUF882 family)